MARLLTATIPSNTGSAPPLAVVGAVEVFTAAHRRHRPELHKPLGLGEGEWFQDHAVDDAEIRGHLAHADGDDGP